MTFELSQRVLEVSHVLDKLLFEKTSGAWGSSEEKQGNPKELEKAYLGSGQHPKESEDRGKAISFRVQKCRLTM